MKLFQLFEEIQQYQIYVDLDGVLVDFSKLAKDLVPRWQEEHTEGRDKQAERELWKIVGRQAKQGIPFWGQMDPMPDAHHLWNYIKKYQPQILSATGHTGNPIPEKHHWVATHLGPNVKVNLVQKAVEKAQYAKPNAILIDDKRKALDPWEAAGGIGVLHRDAAGTILQLKKLGL